jgi:hypothetical protein
VVRWYAAVCPAYFLEASLGVLRRFRTRRTERKAPSRAAVVAAIPTARAGMVLLSESAAGVAVVGSVGVGAVVPGVGLLSGGTGAVRALTMLRTP